MASRLTRTNVDIETNLLRRFREVYPQRGAIKWFINGAFKAFLEIHDHDADEEIRQATEQVLLEMEENNDRRKGPEEMED